MARVIEDGGAVATLSKPIRPPSYEPSRLPDPVSCAGSVIIINDRHNNELLPRLAVSSGAAWVRLAYAQEVAQNAVTVDVSPLVRAAVRDMLPSLVPRAPQPALAAPMPHDDETVRTLAQAMLEFERRLSDLQSVVDEMDRALIPVPVTRSA